MESVSLVEAWQHWFAGKQATDLELLGYPILWWGRAGKVLGLASVVALAAEIVGPAKLNQFGNSLSRFEIIRVWRRRGAEGWGRLWGFFVELCLPWPVLKMGFPERYPVDERLHEEVTALAKIPYAYVCSGFLGGGAAVLLYHWWFEWGLKQWPIWLQALSALFVLVLAVTAVGGGMVALATTLSLPIWLLAEALRRKKLSVWIKVVTVICILVGFHFDLLAS